MEVIKEQIDQNVSNLPQKYSKSVFSLKITHFWAFWGPQGDLALSQQGRKNILL